jgi:1-acyl-sn-glycerol-3-phosphate acyltransferase
MRRVLSFLNLVCATLFLSGAAFAIAPFDPKGRRVDRIARLWAHTVLWAAGVSVSVEGGEQIAAPPYLFMSNHQSALDIEVLLASLPVPFKFVAKRELFRIPVFGRAIKKAGYVDIDRKNPREALKALEEAAAKIKGGTSVLIFPEGTRSRDGNLLPFMKGAFSLAIRAEAPIAPVAVIGANALQPPGSAVALKKGRVTVRIGKPIPTEGKGLSYRARLMEEVRNAIEGLTQCPTR